MNDTNNWNRQFINSEGEIIKYKVDWKKYREEGDEILKLVTTEKTGEIQGLIGINIWSRFVYVRIVENAPHNIGINPKYVGVAANLFAYAIKRSYEENKGGIVKMWPKNEKLRENYRMILGAKDEMELGYMVIEGRASERLKKLVNKG